MKQNILDKEAEIIETMIASELDNAVQSFEKHSRNIKNLLSPVIDVAYKLPMDIGNINLKKVSTSSSGL